MTFEEARAEFPVLERFAYLNAGTLGPLSRSTLAALEERLRFDQSQGRGGKAWFESVLALRATIREQLATLVGTTPDRLALTSSTTDACNIVASGLELGPGDEIVTTDSEHPGLLLPLNVSGADGAGRRGQPLVRGGEVRSGPVSRSHVRRRYPASRECSEHGTAAQGAQQGPAGGGRGLPIHWHARSMPTRARPGQWTLRRSVARRPDTLWIRRVPLRSENSARDPTVPGPAPGPASTRAVRTAGTRPSRTGRPGRAGPCLDRAAVGGGDGRDDGQAEPEALAGAALPARVRAGPFRPSRRNGWKSPATWSRGITGPVLSIRRTGRPASVPVHTWTQLSWSPRVLCRTALSARLTTRRSISWGSPSTGAEPRSARTRGPPVPGPPSGSSSRTVSAMSTNSLR